MACNCSKGNPQFVWLWRSNDGRQAKEYTSEVQARARQIKDGGTYVKTAKG